VVGSQYTPSEEAVREFLQRRGVSPPNDPSLEARFYQEAGQARLVQAFFEVDSLGVPILPERGRVFATLPTEMTLPMKLHLQADWLLDITRGHPRDLESSLWHSEIRAQLAGIFAAYLAILADRPRHRWQGDALCGLPDLSEEAPEWLRDQVFLDQLRERIAGLQFLPNLCGGFISPNEALFPPAAFGDLLDGSWRPDLLWGARVADTASIPPRFIETLNILGLDKAMTSEHLASHWADSGVSRWLQAVLDVGRGRTEALVALHAALHRAADEDSEHWSLAALKCIPTQAGTWGTHEGLRRLPGEWLSLPEEARAFLQPLAGPSEAFAETALWQSASSHVNQYSWDDPRRAAVPFLERCPQVLLEKVVLDWWDSIPGGPTEVEVDQVIALTRWVFEKQPTRTSLVKRLLCRSGETLQLLPPGECLLADPYGPPHRQQLFEGMPRVAADYVRRGQDFEEWRKFLEGLEDCPQGAFRLTALVVAEDCTGLAGRFPGLRPPGIRSRWQQSVACPLRLTQPAATVDVAVGWYYLVDTQLPSNWSPSTTPLPGFGVARSRWLAEGLAALRYYAKLRILYVRQGSSGVNNEPVDHEETGPQWVHQLSDQSWVPVKGATTGYRPADVLGSDDPARPEALVADLSRELVSVLEDAGVRFGANVPDLPVVGRLKAEGRSLPLPRLLKAIQDAAAQTKDNPGERTQLLRVFAETPLAPSSPGDGSPRVSSSRLVRRAGTGSAHSSLGGWVVSIENFETGTIERQILDLMDALVGLPTTTTAVQALEYLRDVWRRQPSSEDVRRNLPLAYGYVLEQVETDAGFAGSWSEALAEARVYARVATSRAWHRAHEVVFNDLASVLPPNAAELSRRLPPVAASGHLGSTSAAQETVAALLSLPLLSQRVTVEHHYTNARPVSKAVVASLRDVRAIIEAVRSDTSSMEDSEDDDEARDLSANSLPLPEALLVDGLSRDIVLDQEPVIRQALFGAWDGARLLLSGTPVEFAGDLAASLVELWHLSQRAELVAQMAAALVLADDRQAFEGALRRMRLRVGLETASDARFGSTGADLGQEGTRSAALPEKGTEPGDTELTPASTGSGGGQGPKGAPLQGLEDVGEAGSQHSGQSREQGPPVLPAGSSRTNSECESNDVPNDRGSGSYSMDRAAGMKQYHEEQLRRLLVGEALRDANLEGPSRTAVRRTDEEYREAAMEFERTEGRYPVPGAETQAGFDIESYESAPDNPDSRVARRIEVKGRSAAWAADEMVSLSQRQFNDALRHDAEASGWDYWLYVVTDEGQGRYVVTPLRNPARSTAQHAFRADIWKTAADGERAVKLQEQRESALHAVPQIAAPRRLQ